MENSDYARKLTEILGLETAPVAVKFIRTGEAVPEGFSIPAKKLRFCQAVMEATWGKNYNIIPAEIACGPGPSYFGAPAKEKVAKGEAHVGLGLFGSAEAASRDLSANVKVLPATLNSVIVGPLEKFPVHPDVVVLRASSEQTMWILHSRAFKEGKHVVIDVQTEGSLCSGVTISAFQKNEVQVGFGCFGCRSNTNLAATDIAVGIPITILPEVVETLDKLRTPMASAKAKRGYYESYPEKKPAAPQQ